MKFPLHAFPDLKHYILSINIDEIKLNYHSNSLIEILSEISIYGVPLEYIWVYNLYFMLHRYYKREQNREWHWYIFKAMKEIKHNTRILIGVEDFLYVPLLAFPGKNMLNLNVWTIKLWTLTTELIWKRFYFHRNPRNVITVLQKGCLFVSVEYRFYFTNEY